MIEGTKIPPAAIAAGGILSKEHVLTDLKVWITLPLLIFLQISLSAP